MNNFLNILAIVIVTLFVAACVIATIWAIINLVGVVWGLSLFVGFPIIVWAFTRLDGFLEDRGE